MASDETLQFYAEHAEIYAQHRTEATGRALQDFLNSLPPRARILELGCGNGLDACYMLERGFDVEATDGTAELATIAARRLGRPVSVLRFEDLEFDQAFDGVWAAASLLHVASTELTDVLKRVHRSLRPGGLFTASFKAGSGEGHDALGRYYNYPTLEGLEGHYRAAAGWQRLDIRSMRGSGFDNQPTDWLWATARR